MKNILITIITLIFCLSSLNAQESKQATDEFYQIQRGDVLNIYVMDHGEFTANGVIVLPDGFIQYPLLGSIKVVGKTPTQIRTIIKDKLLTYIPNPEVTVFIQRLYKQDINILGYVNNPGKYQIFEPTDILTTLALAGGIEELKKVDKIRIIKFDGRVFNLRLSSLWELKRKNIAGTDNRRILIYPGDTVLVPKPREFNWALLTFAVSSLNIILQMINILNK
jgi:polysaccharide export outer membrane protein